MAQLIIDSTPMPFGKYAGKPMVNVPAPYLMWLFNNGCSHEGVKQYILNNLDVLRKEVSRIPKR